MIKFFFEKNKQKPFKCPLQGEILNYLAPEAVFEIGLGVEADLWNLGVIIFELSTGIWLFSAYTRIDIIGSIMNFFELSIEEIHSVVDLNSESHNLML